MSQGSGSRATEQPVDRGHPVVADVDAACVHIERNVLRADLVRHLVRERADVGAARLRVREGVLHRGANRGLRGGDDIRLEVAPREDPGERDGQTGLALPPLAEVGDGHEPVVGVRETALVDDQAGIDLARGDRGEDSVVAQLDHVAERRCHKAEEQEGRRLAARDGDGPGRKLLQRACFARDHERADAVTERSAAPQQPVPIARGSSHRAEAQLRELELGVSCPLVQLLDVEQHGLDLERRGNEPVHQRMERERVVGARREAEGQRHERPKNHFSSGLSSSSRVNGLTSSPWPSPSETVKSSSSVSFAACNASPSS